MNKINKHILVLKLPRFRITPQGSKELKRVLIALRRNFSVVEEFTIHSRKDLFVLATKKPDVVFIGASPKRIRLLEDGTINTIWLSEFLENSSMLFTGSNCDAIYLDSFKLNAKAVIHNAGIKTAGYFNATPNQFISTDILPLDYPMFIKPPDLGGGKGVDKYSVVHNFDEFEQKINSISLLFESESLVEKYLHGREFTVAVMKNYITGELEGMPVEIITEKNSRGDRIVGGNVKKSDKEKIQAVADKSLSIELADFAVKSFEAINAKDYGRIDIRMDDYGILHFLEANLRPGLGGGYFTRACWINQSICYDDVISNIVNLALQTSNLKSAKEVILI